MAGTLGMQVGWNGFAPGGSLSLSTQVIDDLADQIAWIFQVPPDASDAERLITQLGFGISAVTGTPGTAVISIQGVDATTGAPDGTIKGGASPASVSVSSWGAGWSWRNLSNSYQAARGEWIAIVFDPSSGTWNGSNSVTVRTALVTFFMQCIPYFDFFNGTSWAKNNSGFPAAGFKSSSRIMGFPVSAVTTITTSTSGNRIAMRFNLPAGLGDTFKVNGFRVCSQLTAGTCLIGIWDASGVLVSSTYDSDRSVNASAWQNRLISIEATPPTLNFGTTYYAGIEHNGTAMTVDVIQVPTSTGDELQALPFGTELFMATYNGTSWDVTTHKDKRMLMDLIISDWTEPAGGAGGLLTHPGMAGGLRG